ncbi:MAG: hypothetical protein KBD06_03590 [Candidatus Pacebacteria bacterium]|nr:hypothetical protein [Candidatus Paceibacterota bacterium]
MSVRQFLLYITNNEATSRHEEAFDIGFFIINTAALIGGGIYLAYIGQWEWLPFLLIEYTWAVDTIRHNR